MSLGAAERAAVGAAIAQLGWAVTPPVVPQLSLDQLGTALDNAAAPGSVARGLFAEVPAVRALACSPAVRTVAEAVLGPHCFAVGAEYQDETSDASWRVAWRQDLTIPVARQLRVTGFGPWTVRDGVPRVQPPVEVLERMLVLRVHLDDCGPDGGPLQVLDGSHRVGRLSPAAIDAWRDAARPAECLVERGGIVAFRPLLLHTPSAVRSRAHRRFVQLEFAAEELPPPLDWHDRVA